MTRPIDAHLDEVRQQLLRMASLSEAILGKALEALWSRSAERAAEVKRDDLLIDELDVQIERQVLQLLATQAPVADDLREAFAAKMISVDLERVGDLARNIAKSAQRLATAPEAPLAGGLRTLADETQRILRRALDAFSERDAALAAEVLRDDDQIDDEESHVIRAALEEIRSGPEYGSQEVDFILVAKNLERVADHATNIAEAVILASEAKIVKHADKLGE